MREIRILEPAQVEDYLDIYLNAYPAFKSLDAECRAHYRKRTTRNMENLDDVLHVGLYDGDCLIAIMKLIEFNMNLYGTMNKACGLMSLGVHPMHKKEKAAYDMVRAFEKYSENMGAKVSALLPFNMRFYRNMGYGLGAKKDEYRIPTSALPALPKAAGDPDVTLRFLEKNELEIMLECYKRVVRKTHGMIDKFTEEVMDMEADETSKWVGCFRGNELEGYLVYNFKDGSDHNFTLNEIAVDELIYENGRALRELLGYLRKQEDLVQTVTIRSGDPDFYHVLEDPQDTSGHYIPFGYLETNVSAVGYQYKVVNVASFIQATRERKFPISDLRLDFTYYNEMTRRAERTSVAFRPEADGSCSHWEVMDFAGPEDASYGTRRVDVQCKKGDLSALLMNSASFAGLANMGLIEISDPSLIEEIDTQLHYRQKPYSNTDF